MFHAPTLAAPAAHRVYGFLTCAMDFRFSIGKSVADPTGNNLNVENARAMDHVGRLHESCACENGS